MKKRLSIIALGLSSALIAFPISAFAENQIVDETFSSSITVSDDLASQNYTATLAEIDAYVRSLPTVTDGQSDISRAEIDEAIAQQFSATNIERAYFYSDSVELANVLAAYDGVSTTNLATIMYHGYLAQDDASGRQNSDAYRHSTWNFRATKALSASTVRIYTINYEWANELVSTWQDYYDERYDYYFDEYYQMIIMGAMTTSDIILMAESDADDYICEYKDSLQDSCRDSLSTFRSTFNDANIMDWWNNKVGRDYGTDHPSYTPEEMFDEASSNDELILDKDDVSYSDYTYLWGSTNWWYTGN